MLPELREFCEDNNQQPPGPLRAVRARPELSYWSGSDPAIELELDAAAEMRAPSGRAFYLQRVIYDLRYLLLLENGVEFERGECSDVGAALAVARAWLGGGGFAELPKARRPVM